jgi:hypothetical protein
MTRTISIITATVGAALLFAVPAWGDNWGGNLHDESIANAMAEDGFDRAVLAAKQLGVEKMLNARERGLSVNQEKRNASTFDARSDGLNRLYGLGEYSNPIDARERALVVPKTSPPVQGFDARSDGLNRLYGLGEYAPPVVGDFDRFRIGNSNDPVTASATSSGRDIEWPTVGIGFGTGIVLLLGIMLVMKATHTRPFAH